MKNLANCKPSEFLAQTFKIKKSVQEWLDVTKLMEIRKNQPDNVINIAGLTGEERAKAMIAQEEITKLAQQRANEIIANAQAKSRDMRKAAQDFVEELMRRADEELSADLAELRKTRAALKPQIPQTPAE